MRFRIVFVRNPNSPGGLSYIPSDNSPNEVIRAVVTLLAHISSGYIDIDILHWRLAGGCLGGLGQGLAAASGSQPVAWTSPCTCCLPASGRIIGSAPEWIAPLVFRVTRRSSPWRAAARYLGSVDWRTYPVATYIDIDTLHWRLSRGCLGGLGQGLAAASGSQPVAWARWPLGRAVVDLLECGGVFVPSR
jgi:hypothetical protein